MQQVKCIFRFIFLGILLLLIAKLIEERFYEQFNQTQEQIFDLNNYEPIDDSSWNIYSQYVLLVDRESGRVLYQRNANQRMYPASLTKIMTVLVAIEELEQESMRVIYDFSYLYESGAALAGFIPGEFVQAVDLLYGTMLPSGAEAAESLAYNISGSENSFVKLMNKKAKDLGMTQTNFKNVTGLHEEGHYTTARDLAILLNVALSNDLFREIFTAYQYEVPASLHHPQGLLMVSRLFSKIDSAYFNGGQLLGGKTGYTEEAGLCLASLASDGKKEYLLITAGANGNAYTEQTNIIDAFNLYERFLNE